jgi:haloacetate dehalogenase
VLDIVPTGDTLRRADWRFGMGYWHWFFLAQAHPLPERMISADPIGFLFPHGQGSSDFEAYEDFPAERARPGRHLTRCAKTIAPRSASTSSRTRPIAARARSSAPRSCCGATRGVLPKWYDPVGIWKEWASDVRGEEVESGHMAGRGSPDATYQALRTFG